MFTLAPRICQSQARPFGGKFRKQTAAVLQPYAHHREGTEGCNHKPRGCTSLKDITLKWNKVSHMGYIVKSVTKRSPSRNKTSAFYPNIS